MSIEELFKEFTEDMTAEESKKFFNILEFIFK